jgi:outer membrane protein TolC
VAANQALPDRWWSLYNDPVLDGLITQALRDNVELKAADAHLRRAAAVYEQALDAGGFEYEAEAGVSRAQLSAESFLQEHELPVINLADGKFAVSYQFDLFGKLKRGAEAARADEQSVAARATWPRSAWSRRWPTATWKSATPTTSCTWPSIRCSCSSAAARSPSA